MEQDTTPRVHRDSVVARAPGAAFVEVEGEAVVYDEATGRLHLLDPIGTIVWQCLDGEDPVAVLAQDLAEAFGAELDRVERDVLDLCGRLADEGLLAGHEHSSEAAETDG